MASVLVPVSVVGLIFGGCCSNVFALEGIIRNEPDSGLLITFLQFAFISVTASPAPLFAANAKSNNGKGSVPMWRWAYIAFLFYSINMLNNWAFAFNISVPVHIILRSFGSVTTMLAGVIRGKRYSKLQVGSVAILTVGVLVSAWADSLSKGKAMKVESNASNAEFTTGLAILLIAQSLSAYMGAYVEDTYAAYGASWTENLFYSHFLALPLFLPISSTLRSQWSRLASTPPLDLQPYAPHAGIAGASATDALLSQALAVAEAMPQGVLFLLLNALAQLACISGVNLLSAKCSAVTVTIVLNIRKLVSFIFSTVIFGHRLSPLMVLGSALVFGSGALYGWETSWRLPAERRKKKAAAGMVEVNGSVNGKVGGGKAGEKEL